MVLYKYGQTHSQGAKLVNGSEDKGGCSYGWSRSYLVRWIQTGYWPCSSIFIHHETDYFQSPGKSNGTGDFGWFDKIVLWSRWWDEPSERICRFSIQVLWQQKYVSYRLTDTIIGRRRCWCQIDGQKEWGLLGNFIPFALPRSRRKVPRDYRRTTIKFLNYTLFNARSKESCYTALHI